MASKPPRIERRNQGCDNQCRAEENSLFSWPSYLDFTGAYSYQSFLDSPLYKSVMHLQLEYQMQFWLPCLTGVRGELEEALRRVVKMSYDMKSFHTVNN